MNRVQSWGLRIKHWWNLKFYCSYWECAPKVNETWWRDRSGNVVLFEPKPCGKCGRMMGGPDNGEA